MLGVLLVATALKTDRRFCSACGWPLTGQRCEACGSEPRPLELEDGVGAELSRSLDSGDLTGMEKAVEAFRNREWTRFVGLCVAAAGDGTARAVATSEGPGWIAVVRSGLVFVAFQSAAGQQISIEAPLVRLPREKRVPVLRTCLELSRAELPSRVCLRDDLLLLRFTSRLAAITPALLRRVLEHVGGLAHRYVELLACSFAARPAVNFSDRATVGWEAVGETRALSKPVLLTGGRAVEVLTAEPPPLAVPVKKERESIPAILAPLFAQASPPPAIPPPPRVPSVPPPRPPRRPSDDKRRTAPEPAVARAGDDRARASTLEIEAVALDTPRRPGSIPPSGEVAILPPDRLVTLLQRAQALASLSFEGRPGTMHWLIRSTVYRAIYEFRDTLPDAVALLYRTTGMAPPSRTNAAAAPEPALLVFERVIGAKGSMAKEKPIAIDPMTTAQQARDHVSRYLAEIEAAPNDAGLRHFLALGALSELLVRAKLPQQTGQRLRDIVSHAHREGAKPHTIELLMMALKRISA
jgi:hypothetical protein